MGVDLGSGRQTRLLGARSGSGYDPSWSPDGGAIAFLARRPRASPRQDAYVMAAGGARPNDISRGLRHGATSVQWSPDGERLLVVAAGRPQLFSSPGTASLPCHGVWVMPRAGGAAQRIGCGFQAAWSSDGAHVVYTRQTVADPDFDVRHSEEMTIWTVAAGGGDARRLVSDASLDALPMPLG